MKVAYICADPGIPVFGTKGASIHIQEVLRALLKKGADITLFAQRLGGTIPAEFQQISVQCLPTLPSSSEPEERARAALNANAEILRQLKAAGPFDMVYERYSLWSSSGMRFARMSGITGILEVNAPLIEEQRKYREMPLEEHAEQVLRSVLSDASTVICVSPGVKRYLDAFSIAQERTYVVANGVRPDRFIVKDKSRQETLTVGFLGTLKPWHGLHTLIAAFELLHQRGRKVELSIVGDGPEFEAVHRRLEQQGLLAFARFSGAVEPVCVPGLLAEMDIAVAPYPQLEAFYFSPLKIYEYMAAGLPVITTRVGHLATVVAEGKTGLLVEPDSPKEMCDAIECLLDNVELRHTLGKAGRFQVEQFHSWDAVVSQILFLAGIDVTEGIA